MKLKLILTCLIFLPMINVFSQKINLLTFAPEKTINEYLGETNFEELSVNTTFTGMKGYSVKNPATINIGDFCLADPKGNNPDITFSTNQTDKNIKAIEISYFNNSNSKNILNEIEKVFGKGTLLKNLLDEQKTGTKIVTETNYLWKDSKTNNTIIYLYSLETIEDRKIESTNLFIMTQDFRLLETVLNRFK